MIEDNVTAKLPVVLTRVIIPLLEQVSIPSAELIKMSLKNDQLLIGWCYYVISGSQNHGLMSYVIALSVYCMSSCDVISLSLSLSLSHSLTHSLTHSHSME